jgi:uncharacterized DUF497 family protein
MVYFMNLFEWDKKKNELNIFKHDVSFEEASTVFRDEYAVTLFDEEHSNDENRFIIIGISENLLELAVCHCYRGDNENIIRIISARKANNSERDIYERGLNL